MVKTRSWTAEVTLGSFLDIQTVNPLSFQAHGNVNQGGTTVKIVLTQGDFFAFLIQN